VLTAERMDGTGSMAGMDPGPSGDLGSVGWFGLTWALMMGAMMLPALVPAALASARGGGRAVAAFVVGYLGSWTAAGLAVYGAVAAVGAVDGGALAWDRGGRYFAAAAILAAAGYQLSAGKQRCLGRCRAPLPGGPAGPAGALRDGVRHGFSCIGCCAGLMAALFALGVMSLTWMAVIAALIVAERLLPWRAPAAYGVAATLLTLGTFAFVAGPL
jgi:predicted metal-binding membrane protein